jgi:hypothetical protein
MPHLLPDLKDILKALEAHRKEILNTKNPEEIYADPVMMQFFNEYDENVMNCTYLIDSFDQLSRRKIVFSNFRKEYLNSKRLQTLPNNVHVFRESMDGSQRQQQEMMEQMSEHQQNNFIGHQYNGGVPQNHPGMGQRDNNNFEVNPQFYSGPTQNYGGPSDQLGGAHIGFQQNMGGGHAQNFSGASQPFGAQNFTGQGFGGTQGFAGGPKYVGGPQNFEESGGEQSYLAEQQLYQEQAQRNRFDGQSGAVECNKKKKKLLKYYY